MDTNVMGQSDEGFFEPPHEGPMLRAQIPGQLASQLEAVKSLPIHEQQKFVMELLQNFPTASVAQIVQSVCPRLYINFVQHLPLELVLKVLSYLDVLSLLKFSKTCRAWYHVSLDSRLWKDLYRIEGWTVNNQQLLRMEKWANSSQLSLNSIDFQFSSPARRKTDHEVDMCDSGSVSNTNCSDTCMSLSTPGPSDPDHDFMDYIDRPTVPEPTDTIPKLSLFSFTGYNDRFSINWKYIYVMRHRLERNWRQGVYTNFQFPHPKFPEEGHIECVYSLQFTSDYLVSGSRDRTIRVWDVRTQRLVRAPLYGHTASVLCLQFDASPEEDIIASGSSDSNVIVWKFSTGEILHRLDDAHRESVLNLRFDKHVLVTCSKDQTIRVFNRHPLKYGDPGYGPGDPNIVSQVPAMVLRYGYEAGPADFLPVKPAYETICILNGHTAPVNAVQIHDKEIVSASGDRLIKLWNWEKGVCSRTVQGHIKGIACVQYDGRRIVSGSSDNEIKIFDSRTGAIVASLKGHSALVRTLQAGFADMPTSVEDDEKEARLVDEEFDRAVAEGHIGDPNRPHIRSAARPNVPGSRRPDQLLSRGAKLPPGGGGGVHARIVSGSYDQSIIVWRRSRERIWEQGLVLAQEDAIINAQIAEAQRYSRNMPLPLRSISQWQELASQTLIQNTIPLEQAIIDRPELMLLETIFQNLIDRVVATHARTALRDQWQRVQCKYVDAVTRWNLQHTNPNAVLPPLRYPDGLQFTFDPELGPPLSMAQIEKRFDMQPARIFKVQFDATKIVACTHKPTIVGWDFCNADRELKALERVFLKID